MHFKLSLIFEVLSVSVSMLHLFVLTYSNFNVIEFAFKTGKQLVPKRYILNDANKFTKMWTEIVSASFGHI